MKRIIGLTLIAGLLGCVSAYASHENGKSKPINIRGSFHLREFPVDASRTKAAAAAPEDQLANITLTQGLSTINVGFAFENGDSLSCPLPSESFTQGIQNKYTFSDLACVDEKNNKKSVDATATAQSSGNYIVQMTVKGSVSPTRYVSCLNATSGDSSTTLSPC